MLVSLSNLRTVFIFTGICTTRHHVHSHFNHTFKVHCSLSQSQSLLAISTLSYSLFYSSNSKATNSSRESDKHLSHRTSDIQLSYSLGESNSFIFTLTVSQGDRGGVWLFSLDLYLTFWAYILESNNSYLDLQIMFYVICLLVYYRDSRPSVWHKKYYYTTVVHEYIAGSSVTVAEVREAIVYSTEGNGLEQTLL